MKYVVQIPIAGSISIEVCAESKDEALALAWGVIEDAETSEDAGVVEWDYFDTISEGNVCHAPCNSVAITRVRA